MKNTQRGFVVPLLLAIIALLVIGAGVFFYTQRNQSPGVVLNGIATTSPQTTNQESSAQPQQTNSSSSVRLTVSPTSGTAPLTVTLTGMVPESSWGFWGEGIPSANGNQSNIMTTPVSCKTCMPSDLTPISQSHTYQNPGVYTITLYQEGEYSDSVAVRNKPSDFICDNTEFCVGPLIGSATVTILATQPSASGGSADTLTTTMASGSGSGNSVSVVIYPQIRATNGNLGTFDAGPAVFNAAKVSVINGRWSAVISPPLTLGSRYYVSINAHTANFAVYDDAIIAQAGLPSATIDQSSLTATSGSQVRVTGTVSNTFSIALLIFKGVVSLPTVGGFVAQTMPGYVWENVLDTSSDGYRWTSIPNGVAPQFPFPVLQDGMYTVGIYDNGNTTNLLTSGTLQITN